VILPPLVFPAKFHSSCPTQVIRTKPGPTFQLWDGAFENTTRYLSNSKTTYLKVKNSTPVGVCAPRNWMTAFWCIFTGFLFVKVSDSPPLASSDAWPRLRDRRLVGTHQNRKITQPRRLWWSPGTSNIDSWYDRHCYSAYCHSAECHSAKCHSAKCHSAECHSAECHSAICCSTERHFTKCHFAECCSA